jgi:hypothetical protein
VGTGFHRGRGAYLEFQHEISNSDHEKSLNTYSIFNECGVLTFQVNEALEDAPIYQEKEGAMIDYVEFCKILSGRA